MKTPQISYKLYPSLLDAYQEYLDSEAIWERYYGWSDNPPCSPEEFQQKQYQGLLDKINRVPFDSDAADKGTAFNEVIDCMVLGRNSKRIAVTKVQGVKDKVVGLEVAYKEKTFYFPLALCQEFANYYKGAVTQQFVEATIPTIFDDVLLYGFVDYIMPFCIHDLKTTSSYSVGKFKKHWQHIVYPYCLYKSGCDVQMFEYNVAEIGKSYYRTYTETYCFKEDRDIPKLSECCEDFIRFLQDNREKITDKKIFNLE